MLYSFADDEGKVMYAFPFKDRSLYNIWSQPGVYPGGCVFPGPWRVDVTDDDWFGTLDKECTMSFSWYPISPKGHVMNATYKHFRMIDTELDFSIPDINFSVSDADVMFYNEWGMPLFKHSDYHYDYNPFNIGSIVEVPDLLYAYYEGDLSFETEVDWKYCFDEEISYAIVTAHGYDSNTMPLYMNMNDSDVVYIPIRVDAEQLKEQQTYFLFTKFVRSTYAR